MTTEEDFLLLSEAAFGALKEAPGASLLLLDALERLRRKREPEAEPPKGARGGFWVDVRGFSWVLPCFALIFVVFLIGLACVWVDLRLFSAGFRRISWSARAGRPLRGDAGAWLYWGDHHVQREQAERP